MLHMLVVQFFDHVSTVHFDIQVIVKVLDNITINTSLALMTYISTVIYL